MRRPSIKYLGDLALVRLPRDFTGDLAELGKKVLNRGGVRTVLLVEGVEGWERVPKVRFLAGSEETETVHREYGWLYCLDASKVMFSLGNSYERLRMSRLPHEGEVVVDMFAGVGQFTIPLAKSKAGRVVAFEINPEAYRYLVKNIQLNKVSEKVTAYNDDCRNAVKYGLAHGADRVVMGYLFGTIEYLPAALQIAKDGAAIHFHEAAEPREGWKNLYNKCLAVSETMEYRLELSGYRVVKSYSPKIWHYVLDLRALPKPLLEPAGNT
jgi:tRNA wybutosine-synthesizing protein 2